MASPWKMEVLQVLYLHVPAPPRVTGDGKVWWFYLGASLLPSAGRGLLGQRECVSFNSYEVDSLCVGAVLRGCCLVTYCMMQTFLCSL